MIEFTQSIYEKVDPRNKTAFTSPEVALARKMKYYFYIQDCILDKAILSDSAFENTTGHPPRFLKWSHFKKLIHEQDQDDVNKYRKRATKLTSKLDYGDLFKYVIYFHFRIRCANKRYIRVLEKRQVIEVTTDGKVSKLLIQHQVIPSLQQEIGNNFKIFDLTTNTYIKDEHHFHLTKREFEILRLIKEGYNSGEISDKLVISIQTIQTHRKNILAKSQCNSFIEVIQKYESQEAKKI
ncbi:response regulator transcription factor [Myroides sp. LJL115]